MALVNPICCAVFTPPFWAVEKTGSHKLYTAERRVCLHLCSRNEERHVTDDMQTVNSICLINTTGVFCAGCVTSVPEKRAQKQWQRMSEGLQWKTYRARADKFYQTEIKTITTRPLWKKTHREFKQFSHIKAHGAACRGPVSTSVQMSSRYILKYIFTSIKLSCERQVKPHCLTALLFPPCDC